MTVGGQGGGRRGGAPALVVRLFGRPVCTLGRAHSHPMTRDWVTAMRERTSRTGMRELTVRALPHSAALGDDGDGAAAAPLAAEVDNDELAALLP